MRTSNSSAARTVSSAPVMKEAAGTARSPLVDRRMSVASNPAKSAGGSARGSAKHRLPPIVPEDRTLGLATSPQSAAKGGRRSRTFGSAAISAWVARAPHLFWVVFRLRMDAVIQFTLG